MNNVAQITTGELVDDMAHFFAPMSADMIDGLIGQYQSMLGRIHGLAAAVRGEKFNGALRYFVEGNTRDRRHSMPLTIDAVFNVESAVALLNASYWDRALKMTVNTQRLI